METGNIVFACHNVMIVMANTQVIGLADTTSAASSPQIRHLTGDGIGGDFAAIGNGRAATGSCTLTADASYGSESGNCADSSADGFCDMPFLLSGDFGSVDNESLALDGGWSCGLAALSARVGHSSWASNSDYQNSLLTDNRSVSNRIPGSVYNFRLTDNVNTNSALNDMTMLALPVILSGRAEKQFPIRHHTPERLLSLWLNLDSEASNLCYIAHSFPRAQVAP